MSERSTSVNLGFPWLLTFIVMKFVGPCAAWSWRWLLLPPVPVLVEIVKLVFKV
jgi:hypothetical protein